MRNGQRMLRRVIHRRRKTIRRMRYPRSQEKQVLKGELYKMVQNWHEGWEERYFGNYSFVSVKKVFFLVFCLFSHMVM
jgi:hypothetical protein